MIGGTFLTSVERPCLHCRRNDRLNCVNLRQSRQILRAGARVAAFKANEEGQTTKKSQRENERKKDDDTGTRLANVLLRNAASLLSSNRSEAYCRTCKGTGKILCQACKGSGIVEPEKVRMNAIRHGWNKLKSLLPGSGENTVSMHDSDWFKSNRCKRCLGRGVVLCPSCGGSGRRAQMQSNDDQT